ncbi:MAG TPA: YidC/Oxa1 family membrane protein insertase [Candidatus Acidoferrum sp.]|nr:YidC/Oxa1 family membrane protein insertase [Candidatus Acidoferrum sp.]
MHPLAHVILAASWLDPIVNALSWVVLSINKPIQNLGITLVIFAALIRLVFWPLNTAQFKSMLKMQRIAPQIKKLQARYKDDQPKQQQETMALYKQQGVNPLAGCWPMLVQYPFIISVYYVVLNHRQLFENQDFLWIGSPLSQLYPKFMAVSLAHSDIILLVLYALSMYLSVRFGSMPASDPQQASMQRTMSLVSPVMLGFFGWKYQWPSAMVLYWLSYNLFTMGQTFYMLRRYHEPLSFADSEHVITDDVQLPAKPVKAISKNAAGSNGTQNNSAGANGNRSKKKKKGAQS